MGEKGCKGDVLCDEKRGYGDVEKRRVVTSDETRSSYLYGLATPTLLLCAQPSMQDTQREGKDPTALDETGGAMLRSDHGHFVLITTCGACMGRHHYCVGRGKVSCMS